MTNIELSVINKNSKEVKIMKTESRFEAPPILSNPYKNKKKHSVLLILLVLLVLIVTVAAFAPVPIFH